MTPIPGPIILLALPLLAAVVTYSVRRWATLAAFLAAATTGSLALLCLRLPLDRSAFVLGQEVGFGRPVVIVGRNLVVTPSGQIWLAFVFALTTVLFLFAWRISQGRLFIPFGLAILGLYALVTLLQNFSLAVLVFAISTTLAVFMVQGGLDIPARGAQRYLLVALLAVPLLLAAAWLMDQSVLGPDRAELARRALLPAALGFGLLLAIFPFGTWMPTLAADAPPMVTAFLFSAGQGIALFLLLTYVRDAPALLYEPAMPSVILFSGLVMAASGGLMAAVQYDFAHLLGYAALSDLGYLLLALATGGSQSQALALMHVVSRAVSITLMAAALSIVRSSQQPVTDHFDRLHGLAHKAPIAMMGLMIGGLGLAGFPLTAGFPTHWAIGRVVWNWAQPSAMILGQASLGIDTVSGGQWLAVFALVALVASSGGIFIGLLRGLSAALGSAPLGNADSSADAPDRRQYRIASAIVLALAALSIAMGLNPQLLSGHALGVVVPFAPF